MRLKRIIASIIVCGVLAAFMPFASATDKTTNSMSLAIIVANDAPKDSISEAELNLIYWRKKEYWANGKRIRPVNLPSNHPFRVLFSRTILGSTPTEQSDYWNGLYFHGVSPPHIVNSVEAVIRFVQETKGAVGYVNACNADERVKTIAWINESGEVVNDAPNLRCAP